VRAARPEALVSPKYGSTGACRTRWSCSGMPSLAQFASTRLREICFVLCLSVGGCESNVPAADDPQRFEVSASSCRCWATRRVAAPKSTSLGFLAFTRPCRRYVSLFSSSSLSRCQTPKTSHGQSATAQHVLGGDRFTTKSWRRAFRGSWRRQISIPRRAS
jgi:hypothetical protein